MAFKAEAALFEAEQNVESDQMKDNPEAEKQLVAEIHAAAWEIM